MATQKLITKDDAVCDGLMHDQHRYGCSSMHEDMKEKQSTENLLNEFQRRRSEHGPIQSRNKWAALTFGQLVTLVGTSMNATSYALEYGMHRVFPMFLLLNSYIILMLYAFHGLSSSHKIDDDHSLLSPSPIARGNEASEYRLPFTNLELRTPWHYYLILSILDIGPNYLTLLAMNKTSFTSVTLLGSLTIPSTMVFCSLLLGKEYRRMHYVGVILCLIGGSLTVFTDKVDVETTHPHSYVGDILAVLAALGYGVGDACAEFWSKHVDRAEYLGMIGLFGSIFTLVTSYVYERNTVLAVFTEDYETILKTICLIIWYTACLVGYYVSESSFLMKSDATLLNLSLQMSNFWAVLFSIAAFSEAPDSIFYVATIMVISGAFVYELYGNHRTEISKKENLGIATESSSLNCRGSSSV